MFRSSVAKSVRAKFFASAFIHKDTHSLACKHVEPMFLGLLPFSDHSSGNFPGQEISVDQ